MQSTTTGTDQAELLGRARQVFPGGVLGTFHLDEREFVASHGAAGRLWSVDGREYVDFLLGAGALALGHAHPAVVSAVTDQLSRGTTFYELNQNAIELAGEILSALPPDSKLMFTSSGAEATFFALRIARAFTGRTLIVKFAGGYHGHHDYGMVETFPRAWAPGQPVKLASAGVPSDVADNVLVAEFNDAEGITTLFDRHGRDIAAVLVEPFHRVMEPAPGFLALLRELTSQSGSLLIADEVITGFRFHYGLGQTIFGLEADLTTMGKIIGGGLPLAALGGRADVMAMADYHRSGTPEYAFVSGTLNGNPLAAAAGLATLHELRQPGVYERFTERGHQIRTSLRDALVRRGHRVHILGRGPLFFALFGGPEEIRNSADVAAADLARTKRFQENLIDAGVLVNPGQRSFISAVHTDDDIEYAVHAIETAAEKLA